MLCQPLPIPCSIHQKQAPAATVKIEISSEFQTELPQASFFKQTPHFIYSFFTFRGLASIVYYI